MDRRTRITANVITITVIIALCVAMAFTTGLAGNHSGNMGMPAGQNSQQQMAPPDKNGFSNDSNGQKLPDMNNGSDDSQDNQQNDNSQRSDQSKGQQPPDQNGHQSDNDSQQPPDINNGAGDNSSTNGQPPTPPNSNNSSDSDSNSQSGQPPTPPDSNNSSDSNSNNGQPPTPPSGDSNSSSDSSNQSGQQLPEMPDGQQPPDMNGAPGQQATMSTGDKVLTGAEGLAIALLIVYLIMSRGNRKTFKETIPNKKKIATLAIATVFAGGALTTAGILIPASTAGDMNGAPQQTEQTGPGGQDAQSTSSVEATGAETVDGEEKTLNDSYESTTANESAILVTNGGTLTSDGATLNKASGDGSDTDSCDFHGVNAGLLVNEGSTATLKNATIKTAATLSNGVFCTGENSKIEISDSTVETTGERSCRGLDATNGGTIIADNMKIKTQGGSCATLATDRGEGTVTVTNSQLETNGAGSPVIYSTGDISIDNTTGTANGAQITVVEGKNSATITDSEVTCSAAGNRGDVDVCGIMLYQSMSGDADEGTSTFTAKNSTLSIDKDSEYYKTAPMFFVTNTDSVIKLTNTKLNFGSGTLLSVKGTTEWGNEGSNGGNVKVIANNQTLKGDIEADNISTVSISLKNGSTFSGSINTANEAKTISLKISKDSKVTLTGDTYVSSLEDEDSTYSNIDFNGHKLYVDGTAIN